MAKCKYCDKEVARSTVKMHESRCLKNPDYKKGYPAGASADAEEEPKGKNDK